MISQLLTPPPLGTKYGLYKIISESVEIFNEKLYWQVRCVCGKEKWVQADSLRFRRSQGCKSCKKILYHNKHVSYDGRPMPLKEFMDTYSPFRDKETVLRLAESGMTGEQIILRAIRLAMGRRTPHWRRLWKRCLQLGLLTQPLPPKQSNP